ncbi:MAG: carbonic anhydrase [Beijerinckiaceae bacterium]|nr:carbonic anhydrase [Beijerinckiaceae bacterium]
MCTICDRKLSRRGLFGMGAGLAVALTFGGESFAAGGHTTSVTAEQALAKLRDGNQRYVTSPDACYVDMLKTREAVAKNQEPWATVLTCADSRVPPELLFGGVSVGDLFVARNAGNMADTATMGTIEYGAAVLGVPLIVVLGHARCGAVAAACEVVEKHTKFPGSIGPMVQPIVPAARAERGKPGDFVDNTVRASARRTARKISTSSKIVAGLIKSGKVKVVSAYYDLDNGRVEFLA